MVVKRLSPGAGLQQGQVGNEEEAPINSALQMVREAEAPVATVPGG